MHYECSIGNNWLIGYSGAHPKGIAMPHKQSRSCAALHSVKRQSIIGGHKERAGEACIACLIGHASRGEKEREEGKE
eukprot:1150088-Pelagomonas_calceolata.AAC.2